MANLFPFPYADATKTLNGITYTVDDSDESVTITGTATADSQFYVVEASDPIELGPGYYTLQGTGNSDIQIALISVYTPGGSILYIQAGEDDAEFTLTETKEFHAQIGVPSGTTADLTVTPGLVKTGDLVTIDAENAKQIRQTMDVIIQVTPEQGEPIVINNSNLISCTVSLRSDLSIIEPTLPESEINIEAYFDDDISDVLASIPDETPVTYQAGYPGDMSPVRNFYLAEQITWQDNVMSIHAVDAVHKLDKEIGSGLYMNSYGPSRVAYASAALIKEYTGNDIMDTAIPYISGERVHWFLVDDGFTARDFAAQVMWLLHQKDDVWYTYVDAGIPKFTGTKPSSIWDIYEDDCGDVKRNTERKIANINVQHRTAKNTLTAEIGSATIVRNVGTTLSFNNSYIESVVIGVGKNNRGGDLINSRYSSVRRETWVVPLVPATVSGKSSASMAVFPDINYSFPESRAYSGMTRLLKDGVAQDDFCPIGGGQSSSYSQLYTQFVPWDCTYDSTDSFWTDNPDTTDIRSQSNALSVLVSAGVIGSSDDADITIGGYILAQTTEPATFSSGNDGVNVDIDSPPWFGSISNENYGLMYPNGAYNSLLSRSNITGSFTWKGDPRMQPRDVVTFHRLDGTTETITIENITLSHERGGLSAEITYRCGIC